jgi:hypothetical protein
MIPLILLGGGVLVIAYFWQRSQAMNPGGGTLGPGGEWTPPDPPGLYDDPVIVIDPRIPPSGIPLGAGLPCPGHPPPPVGWSYWPASAQVTPTLSAWAVQMRNANPIGTFIMAWIDGQLVGARIEYHTLQGATNTSGCWKGLNLLAPNVQPS